jgi:hypothetical protein
MESIVYANEPANTLGFTVRREKMPGQQTGFAPDNVLVALVLLAIVGYAILTAVLLQNGWKKTAGAMATMGILALAMLAFAPQMLNPEWWSDMLATNVVINSTPAPAAANPAAAPVASQEASMVITFTPSALFYWLVIGAIILIVVGIATKSWKTVGFWALGLIVGYLVVTLLFNLAPGLGQWWDHHYLAGRIEAEEDRAAQLRRLQELQAANDAALANLPAAAPATAAPLPTAIPVPTAPAAAAPLPTPIPPAPHAQGAGVPYNPVGPNGGPEYANFRPDYRPGYALWGADGSTPPALLAIDLTSDLSRWPAADDPIWGGYPALAPEEPYQICSVTGGRIYSDNRCTTAEAGIRIPAHGYTIILAPAGSFVSGVGEIHTLYANFVLLNTTGQDKVWAGGEDYVRMGNAHVFTGRFREPASQHTALHITATVMRNWAVQKSLRGGSGPVTYVTALWSGDHFDWLDFGDPA